MYKGFYNLTSAMLTHQHNLNVIGNNIVNISTSGYKQERYVATTFDDVMYSRVTVNESGGTEIGRQSYIRAASDIYTDYSQGIPEPTELPLDFAIVGDGFFAVQDPEGNVAYTRMGNFCLDDEGYLCLPGFGQVLDPQSQPIYLGTDKIRGDGRGVIYFDQPPEQGGAPPSASWAFSALKTTWPWSGTTGACLPARAPGRARTLRSGTSIWSAPTPTWSSR